MLKTLILTGGGMRCAWGAGFLYELNELNIEPETIIASSGNAANAVYFAAHQTESMKRIWTEHLPGKRFIDFSRLNKIIDIDYLVDEVFKKREPLDFRALRQSKTKVVLPIWKVAGMVFEPFTNEEVTYDVLRAAKALSIFYGKTVLIKGKSYADHPVTPRELTRFSKNKEHILTIDTRDASRTLQFINSFFTGSNTEKSETLAQNSLQTVIIKPPIRAHLLSRSQHTLEGIFNDGRRHCRKYFTG